MISSQTRKFSIEEQGLRYKLLIIEVLIFIIPFLTLSYIFYKKDIFLDFSQTVIFCLILLIVLTGLIILRQVFDRFVNMNTLIKRAVNNNEYLIDIQQETTELQEITGSFNNLMKKYEDTASKLDRSVYELFAVKELIEVASKVLDIDELLNLLLEKALTVSKAKTGSIFLLEPENDRFRVAASKGLDSGSGIGSYIKVNESLAQYVVTEKTPLLVEDIENDHRTRKQNNPKYGSPSFLSMPVLIREDLIAVLNVANKETGGLFDTDDQEILEILIGEIGFALENAGLHLKVREHLKDLEERSEALIKTNDQLQQEIVKRKRSEEELQEAHGQIREVNKKLELAYFQMRDAKDRMSMQLKGEENGFFTDEEGQILGASERVIESTGMRRRALIGKSIYELVDEASKEKLKKNIRNASIGIFNQTSVKMANGELENNSVELKLTPFGMGKGKVILVLIREAD
ncbi:GAF domain-containing protein [Thermodesulfobacteriota bacterium]